MERVTDIENKWYDQKIDVIISVDTGSTSTRYSVMDQNRNVVYTIVEVW